MQCLQPCCVSFFASVCLCLCLQLFLGAQCGGVLAVSSGLQLFLGTWWRLRVLFSQEELVVSTLCVGEQCAEAEMLKSGSQGGEEAPSSLQVTSSGLSLFFFFFLFGPGPGGRQSWEASKPTHSQSLPLAPAGLSSVQLLSHIWPFVTPWTAAHQASLSITSSQSLPKLMSTESVMHPTILSTTVSFSSCPQSFPGSGSFQMSLFFASGGQSIGVSASAPVVPMNVQDWFPLGWTGWISLQSKGLSRVSSKTTVQKHQFFSAQLSLHSNSHIHTWLLEEQ